PAVRERVDEAVGAGERGRGADGLLVGLGVAEADVVRDRAAEECRVLRHPRELPPPGVRVAGPEGDPADGHAARRPPRAAAGRGEGGARRRPCALAGAAPAAERAGRAGGALESAPVAREPGPGGGGEGAAPEPPGPKAGGGGRGGPRRAGLRRRLQQVEDP